MQKSFIIDLWIGSKYTSEGILSLVWFPLFHHTLSKQPFEVDLKWNLLKWNWLVLRILSGGLKVFYIKKEENSLSDLSPDIKKYFSANESFITFSFILESQLRWRMLFWSKFCGLRSVFEELFIWETEPDRKTGRVTKERGKPPSFIYKTVIGLLD